MSKASEAFVRGSEVTWEHPDAGVRRQVLAHGPELMLVRVEFEAGAIGKRHHHPHRQATYVAAGQFEVSVGDERRVLEMGDSFFAVANVPHEVRAVTPGTLIDCFTPLRQDFLAARE